MLNTKSKQSKELFFFFLDAAKYGQEIFESFRQISFIYSQAGNENMVGV